MTLAPRVQPESFFSTAQWRDLIRRSSWRGVALLVHCWMVIGLAIAAGVVWPLSLPLMIMVVGTRQLGLFILMHDAAHGLLHPNRRFNDFAARWFGGSELDVYRPYHLQHHRFVQQTGDPDLVLSAPFPITPASLRRKIWRDLSGQTFIKQRFGALAARVQARPAGASVWPLVVHEAKAQRVFLITNGVGFAVFTAAGLWWAWLAMWLLPMATWLPLVTRLRNIAEHALVAENNADPLRHARTTHANLIERALVAPYWVNYHGEHHLFTQIPCWNLPKAHRLLAGKGVTARMEVQPSYPAVLRLASSRR